MKMILVAALFDVITALFHAIIGFKAPDGWRGWVYLLPAVAFGIVVGKVFLQ